MNSNSHAYRVFTIFNYIFLGLMAMLCVVPLIHVLAISLSARTYADANQVSLWPLGFTCKSYLETIGNRIFLKSALFGLLRTVIGPAVSMVVTVMAAYPLSKSKDEFRFRNFYMWFFIFVMLFNGGLIPTYMVIRKLNLINNFFVLILPPAMNVFNMILLMNFFRTSVPKSLEESAQIDGASHLKTLTHIVIPLSLPAIATLSLFSIVFHWNSYFDGLIYMTDRFNYPLATFLQTTVVAGHYGNAGMTVGEILRFSERTIRASQIFLSVIPILIVYPFLQRYFIKGIVLGAIKE